MSHDADNNNILFSPLAAGEFILDNRIIMSPMTRCRAQADRIPNDLMIEYYTQRASAGLIITEATSVCPMGVGYPNTPGIWNKEQVEAWKKITDSVHNKGGKILLQLWHVGRVSAPCYLDGKLPLAPSAIKPAGHVSLIRPKQCFETPKAMSTDDIKEAIESFRIGAENAKLAGFDGVEIHGANGYLLDQFLQDSSNKRTDEYGGSIENRSRFMLEVVDAVCDVWGPGRVGMHLAPRCDVLDMGDSDPLATFTYIANALGDRKLAFIFSRATLGDDNLSAKLRKAFGGVYIVNQQLSKLDAVNAINVGRADAAAWGQLFIANPDLVERFRRGAGLNETDSTTYYLGDEEGYTDYPFL